MPDTNDLEIIFRQGLAGQDGRLDQVEELYEQLQLAAVDICNPSMDVISFSQTADYFAVIVERKQQTWESCQDTTPSAMSALPSSHDVVRENTMGASTLPQSVAAPDGAAINPTALGDGFSTGDQFSLVPLRERRQGLVRCSNAALETETTAFHGNMFEDCERVVGLVYLTKPSYVDDPLHYRELNIGLIIHPSRRGKGYAKSAIRHALKLAFESGYSRVQALLLDHVVQDVAFALFTTMGFTKEGTHRLSFFSPMENVRKDVTYMAILDVDWARHDGTPSKFAPKNVWDALFTRQQREQEEVLRWEAAVSRQVKRSASNATIRAGAQSVPEAPSSTDAPDSETASSFESAPSSPSDRKKAFSTLQNSTDNPFLSRESSPSPSVSTLTPFDLDVPMQMTSVASTPNQYPPSSPSATGDDDFYVESDSGESGSSWDFIPVESSDSDPDTESLGDFIVDMDNEL